MAPHHVQWDWKHRRPIVDGKIENPETGAVEPAGKPITYGPPQVDAIFQNLRATPNAFMSIRMPTGPSLDRMLIRVAKHVEHGLYTLIGVNATAYSFHVICESDLSNEAFLKAYNTSDEDFAKAYRPPNFEPSGSKNHGENNQEMPSNEV